MAEERPQNHMAKMISHRSVCPNTPPGLADDVDEGIVRGDRHADVLMASVTKASMTVPVTKEKATKVKIPRAPGPADGGSPRWSGRKRHNR